MFDLTVPSKPPPLARAEAVVAVFFIALLTSQAAGKIASPQDAPAPHPQDSAESAWKPAFDRVYRLGPGEVLKRVPPPFIPERKALCVAHGHMQGKEPPAYIVFHGSRRGDVRDWAIAYGGDGKLPLRQVLSFPLDLRPFEFDGPDELLSLDLMGDWVIDPDAPLSQKLAALTGVVRAAHGRLVRFERRELERDVIVASGTFALSPLAELREPRLLHLFVGMIDPARGGQQTGGLGELLRSLGTCAGTPVVDETRGPGPAEFTWVVQNSARVAERPAGPARRENLRELLDNVSRQTGLTFQAGRRKVPLWVVVEGPAAG